MYVLLLLLYIFFYYIKNVIKKCVFGRFCLVVCLFIIIINKMFSFCVVRFFCALAFAYASNREEEDSLRRGENVLVYRSLLPECIDRRKNATLSSLYYR